MQIQTKSETHRSEMWLTLIASLGPLLTAYVAPHGAGAAWIALGVAVLMGVVYALARTPLAAKDRPGVKTAAFWGAIVTVLAAGAAAVADAQIPGVPAGVTRVAGLIVTLATAAGYTVHRYRVKTASPD